MKSTVAENFDVLIPKKESFRSFEVAKILDIHPVTVARMCREGKFNYFSEEDFQAGAFKVNFSWRIKRQGIIEYLRRINQ